MREIKFRAKCFEMPNVWLYGYFAVDDGQCYMFTQQGKFLVISGTESQYAELKDRNLKEIYEGDIVQYKRFGYEKYKWGNVWYENENNAQFLIADKSWEHGGNFRFEDVRKETIEIIGNIYENPELLKEKR